MLTRKMDKKIPIYPHFQQKNTLHGSNQVFYKVNVNAQTLEVDEVLVVYRWMLLSVLLPLDVYNVPACEN